MKRWLLASLLLGLLTLGNGFGAYGGDCGCGGPAPVVSGCDAFDECDTYAPCGGCCRPCSSLCNALQIPLKALDWVVHLGYPCRGCCGGCNSGCGERYWGEFSDPVDCCDPCDRCGNWRGRPCSTCYSGGTAGVMSYAKSGNRNATYAQRSPRASGSVHTEFGLDPSAQVVSRTDHVVAPAQINAGQAKPIAARATPHLAPSRH